MERFFINKKQMHCNKYGLSQKKQFIVSKKPTTSLWKIRAFFKKQQIQCKEMVFPKNRKKFMVKQIQQKQQIHCKMYCFPKKQANSW